MICVATLDICVFLFDALLLLLYIAIFAFNIRVFLFTNNRFCSIFDRLFIKFSFTLYNLHLNSLLAYSCLMTGRFYTVFRHLYSSDRFYFQFLCVFVTDISLYMFNTFSRQLYVVTFIFDRTYYNDLGSINM